MNAVYSIDGLKNSAAAQNLTQDLNAAGIKAYTDYNTGRLFIYGTADDDALTAAARGLSLHALRPAQDDDADHHNKELGIDLIVIIGSLAVAAAAYLLDSPLSPYLYLAAWLAASFQVLMALVRGLTTGDVFNENFLMTVATVGAFALGEYPEAVAVMVFFRIGELLEGLSVSRSHKSVSAILDMRPDRATLVLPGGNLDVPSQAVRIGDTIEIRPGQKIPLDAVVLTGESAVDTSSLTGESLPVDVGPGSRILSGCISTNGRLTAEVTAEFTQSTASKIIELVRSSMQNKAPSERFITRFARVYTPLVVAAAVLLALVPPLFGAGGLDVWLYRALVFLVASCPCALVVSIPLTFFSGIGNASRNGILIKGGSHLDTLTRIRTIAFDKTGTLTTGRFRLVRVEPADGVVAEHLLDYAAHAESLSSHPLAKAVSAGAPLDPSRVGSLREWAGKGVVATVDGHEVAVGNAALMAEFHIRVHGGDATRVFVAIDQQYAGSITVGDRLRPDAADAIRDLRDLNITSFAMLTGDTQSAAQAVAAQAGVDRVFASLLPGQKVEAMQTLPRPTLFIGDGINDAPVLAAADLGVAMGGLGSEAAIQAADIVLMSDQLTKLPQAVRIARRTRRIAIQNIVFALAVKAAVLTLGALGIASMWAAVFADVGVTVLAVLNAMRALR